MQPTRKKIELPSGGICVVRRLSPIDCVGLSGIPAAFAEPREGAKVSQPTKEQLEFGEKVTRIIISRCCSAITRTDLSKVTVCDKPLDELKHNEISIEELDQADAEAIVAEVTALSNMGKEAAAKAKPFPAEPKVAGDDARLSEDLRETTLASP